MSDRRAIQWALLVSLLLHLLLVAVTWHWNPLAAVADSTKSIAPPSVRVVLSPLTDEPDAAPNKPTTYTSIPERQAAEAPPPQPDFLALHNAHAADEVPGGEPGAQPAAPRQSENPQVAINRDEGGAPDAVRVLPTPQTQAERGSREAGASKTGKESRELPPEVSQTDRDDHGVLEQGAGTSTVERKAEQGHPTGEQAGEETAAPSTPELARLLAGGSPSIFRDDRKGRVGDRGFDYDQPAVGPKGGNAVRFGEYTLSTIEWDYAPWLERFKQDFLPHWIPPYAYYLGVISGTTTLRLTIERDGELSDLRILKKEGHESLHQASVAAMRATAPFAPLPPDFPDPNLVLIITLHYAPRTPAATGRSPTTRRPRSVRQPGRER